MKVSSQPRTIKRLITFALIASMSAGALLSGSASANGKSGNRAAEAPGKRAANSYPNLQRFALNLTKLAQLGKLEPVKGYDAEIGRVAETLANSTVAPVLLGESNLDRAAIARGLALRIASGDVPAALRDKQIFSLSLDAIAAEATTSQEFANRVQAIVAETTKANGRVVLFVDELQEFAGARASYVASVTFQNALRENNVRIIGGASPAAYSEYIAADGELAKLFETIAIGDTTASDATAANKSDEQQTVSTAEAFEGDKISPDMRALVESAGADGRVSAILQVDDVRSGQLRSLLKRHGVEISERMPQLSTMKVEIPVSAVEELAASGLTNYISPDVTLLSFGHVTATTGTDLIRSNSSLLGLVTTSTLDGKGIGIAVLDSGIDSAHRSVDGNVKFKKDFTTENNPNNDPFGHGTHVASAAAGMSTSDGTRYQGMAPEADIINLRVLNAQGVGSSSGLLSALNWILAPSDPTKAISSTNPRNKEKYNIRVVNMSLGAPAISSYKNDPICRAARALVDAGIVVVAAAGNNGKAADGTKLYGQIHSPGNDPSVITVGAANTFGTDSRSDDVIASYSSRGPTRSFTTDQSGVKHYDNLIKPDLVAPGNKLIYAESDMGTNSLNLLVRQHPELDADIRDDDNRRLMFLSGTSMATPVVAGAAVLMLQANPKLTPNMVKMILMYTTQPIAGFNMLEQGTGELNVEGAIRLAKLIRTDLTASTPQGSPLLSTSNPPTQQSTIANQTFSWAKGIFFTRQYAIGTSLITKYQPYYGLGMLLGDGTLLPDGQLLSDGMLLGDGQIIGDGMLLGDTIWISAGQVLGDGTMFCSGQLLADGMLLGDGQIIGDGMLLGDGQIIGDGQVLGDSCVQAMSATIGGDPGPTMH